MKIRQIEAYRVSLFRKDPLRIASRNRPSVISILAKAPPIKSVIQLVRTRRGYKSENIVVRIVTDSREVGWGEASPIERVTGETLETVAKTLGKLAPHLINTPFSDVEETMKVLDSIVRGSPAAKASIDIALHDILGKACRKPLFMFWGGLRRDVFTDLSIGMESPKNMAEAAADAVRKGFRSIKIKVGGNPKEDVKRVRLVREAIGNDVQLRVDANESWTSRQALDVINRIAPFNVQFVEQPVKAGDLQGLVKIKKNSPIPIMADESVCSLEDAMRLIQAEAIDLINIKLMKCGGMLKAVKIANTAEAAKIPCMIGCWGETKIGITAAAHLAGSIKNITYADLDSDILLEEKLVKKGGATIEGSIRKLPEDAGLGIEEVDETLLGKPMEVYR